MSSTATRNTRTAAVRGGQDQEVRQIHFTLVYNLEIIEVVLADNQTVHDLEKIAESLFKIPIKKLLIYGEEWPAEEAKNSSTQIKNFSLDKHVLLYVAAEGPLDGDEALFEDMDGARAGTSRELNTPKMLDSPSPKLPDSVESQTCQLHVTDVKNHEIYNELAFDGTQSLEDVKTLFADITGIPIEFQQWSGWPDKVAGSSKKLLLKDASLDKPFHSLMLNDIRNNSNIAISDGLETVSSDIICTKESTERLDGDRKPIILEKRKTARKSTTKGALRDAREKLQKCSKSGDANENSSGPCTPKKVKIDEESSSSPSKSPSKHRYVSPFITLEKKIADNIIQYLDPLTQLSLRRTCQATKNWISNNDFTKHTRKEAEKWKKFSLTVTGRNFKTFQTVVNMNLPITRLKFQVDNEEFYEQDDIDTLVSSSYCLRVTEVTLQKFFMFQIGGERTIFESLVNLEKLTIDELVIPETSTILPCPRTLANLQVLKLNYEIAIPQENVLIRPKCWDMTWSMLSDCRSLLYFRFPQVAERRVNAISHNLGIFAPLLDYISVRVRSGGVSLEYLDLKHFNNPESYYINRYVELIRRCYAKDIKLKNVHSLVIQQVFDEDATINDQMYKFCENIVSLINYCPFVENAPLRNLEKITVDVIPSVTDYVTLGRMYKDMFWPRLRVIKIKDSVQQNKTNEIWTCWQEVQEDLYGHNGLFDRGSVQYIKIDSPKLPYFLSEGRLAQKFYNLKRLEIVSWCSTGNPDLVLNKRLHAIWKKLKLEELRIENCPKLCDSSFVGDDDDDELPPFLKLIPTLKKMTLGLDKTNITDYSLIKVFSRMRFKSFILLSTKPTKISEIGLLKLRQRDFGQHIEYFPFDCWSSSRIDPRRFERLGKTFRSIR